MVAVPPKASFPSADDAPRLLAKLREFALVGAGLATNNRLGAFLRVSDLVDAGVIQVRQSALNGGGAGTGGSGPGGRPVIVEPAIDLTPPPAPSGFIATAGTTQILFETAAPIYSQGHRHSRTKVYAAVDAGGPLPTFSDAVLYTDFPGNIGVAPFDPASSLRLWATWTSADGVESAPAGGTNGIAAATGLLEDQHIASLAVGKLLAGALDVGQYIQSADYVAGVSGWRIQTLSGGDAFMEINGGAKIGGALINAHNIRSTNFLVGSQGWSLNDDGTAQIGGITVGVNGLQSTTFVADVQGWQLNYDGTGQIGGFRIRNSYVESSNYVAGTSGWRINQDGTIEAANLTLTGGVIRNSTSSFYMNMNATGSSLLLRAGALTSYGSYAGSHYPVEIYANGAGFFGRGIVSGGTVKASGTYSIPDAQKPAVLFSTAPAYSESGGA